MTIGVDALRFKHKFDFFSSAQSTVRLGSTLCGAQQAHLTQRAEFSWQTTANELRRLSRWRENTSAGFVIKPFGLTIRVTKNNVFMVAYSVEGRVLFWLTRGRKNTNFNLYTKVCSSLVRFMFERFLSTIKDLQVGTAINCFSVYGRVPVKKLIIDLRREFFKIRSLRIAGGLAHNGCRLPKRRRGARN